MSSLANFATGWVGSMDAALFKVIWYIMNRDLKNNVYILKRRFGVYVMYYARLADTAINYETGEQGVVYATPVREKAILLPVDYSINERLGSQMNIFRGDLKFGDRFLIFDKRVSVGIGDYFIYETKQYDIIRFVDYIDGDAKFVQARNINDESVA